jgi:hypothetical protein
MSDRWAALLPTASAPYLATLRRTEGIEVCEQPGSIWLRGGDLELVNSQLCGLPDARRFRCLADGQLVAVDHLVPSGVLPECEWTALAKWLTCTLPPTIWPGSTPAGAALRLVRASTPVEPSLLLLALREWQAYVAMAPQVRLERLSFALDSAGRVLVRGRPLPPLDGRRFAEFDDIAVPVGWHWQPAVGAATLRELLGLNARDDDPRKQQGGLALFTSEDCAWEHIPMQAFVQVTRSAVRLSAEAANELS